MVAPLVASDIYTAVRLYLEESELHKCVKAFDKETTTEDAEPAKQKKGLKKLALVAACQVWLDAQDLVKPRTVEAADVRPALRRFFTEAGLQKSLKAFDKETASDEEAVKSKKAKAMKNFELTAACQLWLEARLQAVEGDEEKPKKKTRKAEEKEEEEVADAQDVADEEPPKKRKKKQKVAAEEEDEAVAQQEESAEAEVSKAVGEEKDAKPDKNEKNRTKIAGTPFQRIDCAKWTKTIKDDRLKNNTHQAKAEYGQDDGDGWGDKSAEDLGKVKGKGFRKEMAKKKRASWRGGGEINQGVNSIAFSDSDDDE